MTKKYVITNSGEADCRLVKELTEEQSQFLSSLFMELNHSDDCEPYHPFISIYESTEDVLAQMEEDREVMARVNNMFKH